MSYLLYVSECVPHIKLVCLDKYWLSNFQSGQAWIYEYIISGSRTIQFKLPANDIYWTFMSYSFSQYYIDVLQDQNALVSPISKLCNQLFNAFLDPKMFYFYFSNFLNPLYFRPKLECIFQIKNVVQQNVSEIKFYCQIHKSQNYLRR